MTTGTVQILWEYRVRHYSSQIPLHTHTHTHTHPHSGRIEAHWRRLLTGQSCLFASRGRQVAAKLTSSKITAQDVWSTLPLEEPSVEIGRGNGTPLQYSCLEDPWTEEPGRLQSMGSLRVGHNWATSLSLFTFMLGEGNGNPLQCSCLESPRDGGAWWVIVYGVTQSRTRLKWLSSSSSSNQYRTPTKNVSGK